MAVTKGIRALVAAAEEQVETLSVAEAMAARDGGALLVDLRDIRELRRDGRIPGSLHVPRGVLEFWVDPDSPYHREALSSAERLVLYCSKGWRSALATVALQDMGLTNVSHIGGGIEAWDEAGGPIETPQSR